MRHQSRRRRRGPGRIIMVAIVVVVVVAVAAGVIVHNRSSHASGPLPVQLPAATGAYLGVYTHGRSRLVRRSVRVQKHHPGHSLM